jgi:hypothetical protein
LIESETVTFSKSSELYVIYIGPSEPDQFRGLPVIHVDNVRFACKNLTYELTVFGADSTNLDFERTVLFNSMIGVGFGISVPSIGNYSLKYKYNATAALSYGSLTHDGLDTFAVVDQDDTFYRNVEVIAKAARCDPLPTHSFSDSSAFTPSDAYASPFLSEPLSYTQESQMPDPGRGSGNNGLAIGVGTGVGLLLVILAAVLFLILRRPHGESDTSRDADAHIPESRIENPLVVEEESSDHEVSLPVDERHPSAAAYSLSQLQSTTSTAYI